MVAYFKRVASGIGERIKCCRLALGMSKALLASKAGLTRPTITYYENRHSTPTLRSLRKLADALGVSVDYLVGLERDPKHPGDLKIQLLFKNIDELNEREILLMEEVCDRIQKGSRKKTGNRPR
jgi:transcriptional regulator with XRE-family HTH domain